MALTSLTTMLVRVRSTPPTFMSLSKQEFLELLVVGDDDLQQVVELAGQEVALEHFRHVPDAVREPLDRVRAVVRQHHVDEAQEVEPHRFAIDDRDVAANDAAVPRACRSRF